MSETQRWYNWSVVWWHQIAPHRIVCTQELRPQSHNISLSLSRTHTLNNIQKQPGNVDQPASLYEIYQRIPCRPSSPSASALGIVPLKRFSVFHNGRTQNTIRRRGRSGLSPLPTRGEEGQWFCQFFCFRLRHFFFFWEGDLAKAFRETSGDIYFFLTRGVFRNTSPQLTPHLMWFHSRGSDHWQHSLHTYLCYPHISAQLTVQHSSAISPVGAQRMVMYPQYTPPPPRTL